MFSLTLNPRFKKLYLVSSFVGQEEGVNIVDEYDNKKNSSYVLEVLSSFASNDKICRMCRRWKFYYGYFSTNCIHK